MYQQFKSFNLLEIQSVLISPIFSQFNVFLCPYKSRLSPSLKDTTPLKSHRILLPVLNEPKIAFNYIPYYIDYGFFCFVFKKNVSYLMMLMLILHLYNKFLRSGTVSYTSVFLTVHMVNVQYLPIVKLNSSHSVKFKLMQTKCCAGLSLTKFL